MEYCGIKQGYSIVGSETHGRDRMQEACVNDT